MKNAKIIIAFLLLVFAWTMLMPPFESGHDWLYWTFHGIGRFGWLFIIHWSMRTLGD